MIDTYRVEDLEEVANLLASAFATNPLHSRLFDGNETERARQLRLLFATSLEHLSHGTKVVLRKGDRIAGFAHWISHPGCRPSPESMQDAGPKLAAGLDQAALARVIAWRSAWGKQDPDGPHSHFGPVAVHPDDQGKSLGRQILDYYCSVIDRAGESSYLEVERPENLALYQQFGFAVTSECEVLGLPNWFMTRPRA